MSTGHAGDDLGLSETDRVAGAKAGDREAFRGIMTAATNGSSASPAR